MVLDLLENIELYEALNPHFSKVVDFLQNTDLSALPLGRNEICGDTVYANVMEVKPKSKDEKILNKGKYMNIIVAKNKKLANKLKSGIETAEDKLKEVKEDLQEKLSKDDKANSFSSP